MVRCQNKGAQRLAEGQIEEELGHHAKGALLEGSHAACRDRHRLRLQHEATPEQRTRQRHPSGQEYLRSLPLLHALQLKGGRLQVFINQAGYLMKRVITLFGFK